MNVSDFGLIWSSCPIGRSGLPYLSSSSSALSPHKTESLRTTNQRTTPDRSGIDMPGVLIDPPCNQLGTHESASGLQVARIYGLTPHMLRLRLNR